MGNNYGHVKKMKIWKKTQNETKTRYYAPSGNKETNERLILLQAIFPRLTFLISKSHSKVKTTRSKYMVPKKKGHATRNGQIKYDSCITHH